MTDDLAGLVDRTLLVGFESADPPEWVLRAASGVGGVVLYGPQVRAEGGAARVAARLRAEADVLIAVDEEGGDVTRLHYGTGSPTPGNYVLGAADDLATTAAVAGHIAEELRAAGIGFNLAPVADVNSDPANPVIGVRSFGADPDLVSRHTAAWVRGLQERGVAACAKHFPGHGDTRVDSHVDLPEVRCAEAEWRRVHLPPFAAAVESGVRAIMTAHVRLPALDAQPGTLSRRLLTDVLRGELGFTGVVVTDALDMGAIVATYGLERGAVAALAAGADALCLGAKGGKATYRRAFHAVLGAVRAGELPADRVAEAAARVDALRAPLSLAPGPGPAPGLDAARRVAYATLVPPLAAPPFVIELRSDPNAAVGAAGWDLAGPLAEAGFPPVRVARVSRADAQLNGALVPAAGHPLVVVGRDVSRTPWQNSVWRMVHGLRGDAVLVDLGLPRPDALGDVPRVLVGGAARPNLRVAAELLVSGSPG